MQGCTLISPKALSTIALVAHQQQSHFQHPYILPRPAQIFDEKEKGWNIDDSIKHDDAILCKFQQIGIHNSTDYF